MPKSEADLPRRGLCRYPDHEGPRWLLWVYFGTYWVQNKKNGIHYLYLTPYCRTCITRKRRKGKGRTGKQLKRLYSDTERLERKRELENAGYKRRVKDPTYRTLLNEANRMRRIAKRELQNRGAIEEG